MEPIASITAQWFINILIAIGRGQEVPAEDLEKVGSVLCQMVDDPEKTERLTFSVGKTKIWCNNAPPSQPSSERS